MKAMTNAVLPARQGFDYFYGLPYSHEEGFPGPSLESIVWPPIPLFENKKIVEQPVDLMTITPRYTNKVPANTGCRQATNLTSAHPPFPPQPTHRRWRCLKSSQPPSSPSSSTSATLRPTCPCLPHPSSRMSPSAATTATLWSKWTPALVRPSLPHGPSLPHCHAHVLLCFALLCFPCRTVTPGTILDTLRTTGLDENTYVVFSSGERWQEAARIVTRQQN